MYEKGIVKKFKGVYAAIFTPFHLDDTINFSVFKGLIEYQLNAGLNGCYVCGSTGEGILMTLDERKQLAECAVETMSGRGNIIVHVGALRTQDAVDLAKHAERIGTDAVSAIPPLFFANQFEMTFEHYKRIAEATSLPFFIYNIPESAGINLTFNQLLALADISGIAGMKFTSDDLFLLHNLSQHFSDDFALFNGYDEILVAGMMMGAHGGIGSTYNVFPGHYQRIFQHAQRGDFSEAQKWQYSVNRYTRQMLTSGGLGACKHTMKWLGFDCGPARGPIINYFDGELKELRSTFENVKNMIL